MLKMILLIKYEKKWRIALRMIFMMMLSSGKSPTKKYSFPLLENPFCRPNFFDKELLNKTHRDFVERNYLKMKMKSEKRL